MVYRRRLGDDELRLRRERSAAAKPAAVPRKTAESAEKRLVFTLVASVIGLDLDQGAGLSGIYFRPLSIGAFDLGAIDGDAVQAHFLGFFHLAACDGGLKGVLDRSRDFLPR